MCSRLALLLALLAVVAAGCGDDDAPSAETLPGQELTVPDEDPGTGEETIERPTTTETTPPPTETSPRDDDSGGTQAPAAKQPQDTPDNDVPPPKDSPAERFEKFCEENPGAC
jgi:hypothetical protein